MPSDRLSAAVIYCHRSSTASQSTTMRRYTHTASGCGHVYEKTTSNFVFAKIYSRLQRSAQFIYSYLCIQWCEDLKSTWMQWPQIYCSNRRGMDRPWSTPPAVRRKNIFPYWNEHEQELCLSAWRQSENYHVNITTVFLLQCISQLAVLPSATMSCRTGSGKAPITVWGLQNRSVPCFRQC